MPISGKLPPSVLDRASSSLASQLAIFSSSDDAPDDAAVSSAASVSDSLIRTNAHSVC